MGHSTTRAYELGFAAIVFTVEVPVRGKRDRELRNRLESMAPSGCRSVSDIRSPLGSSGSFRPDWVFPTRVSRPEERP